MGYLAMIMTLWQNSQNSEIDVYPSDGSRCDQRVKPSATTWGPRCSQQMAVTGIGEKRTLWKACLNSENAVFTDDMLIQSYEYRTKLGMNKVVLRGSWGCHCCKTDRGPPYFRMSLRHVPNFVRNSYRDYNDAIIEILMNFMNQSGWLVIMECQPFNFSPLTVFF